MFVTGAGITNWKIISYYIKTRIFLHNIRAISYDAYNMIRAVFPLPEEVGDIKVTVPFSRVARFHNGEQGRLSLRGGALAL
jgi:hypothetical protein